MKGRRDEGEEPGDRFPFVDILGVCIHQINFAETLHQIARWIE